MHHLTTLNLPTLSSNKATREWLAEKMAKSQAKAGKPEKSMRFIKIKEVKSLTSLSTTEIYRRIAAGTFPKQIQLGAKSVAWIETEILAWVEAQISASRNQ